VVCFAYLGLVLAMLGLWWASPFIAVMLFLAITIYHWGRADLAFESLLNPAALQSTPKLLQYSHALLRGFFPIGLPFLTFPEATESILNACSVSFGYDYALSHSLRVGIVVCLILLLVSEIAYLLRQKEQWKSRLVEDFGLVAFFTLVPPLLAVGLYFCFWHGLRHVLRLIRYEGEETQVVAVAARLKRFYCQALPFTLSSILMIGGILLLLPKLAGLDEFIGIYLVIISALTVPHLLVVEWMDWREGV
jgi:Brp/Blh family beta-carotene 15,15'-monooxygenase